MKGFAHLLTADELAGRLSPERRLWMEARMADHLLRFPWIRSYRIFNGAGEAVMGAGPNPGGFNVSDRAWFQALRDSPPRQTAISDVVLDKGSRVPTVLLGIAFRDDGGRFLGALEAAVELRYFRRSIDSVDIGRYGLVEVRRTDNGRLILRRPDTGISLYEPEKSLVTDRILSGEAAGAGQFISRPDGLNRQYAFNVVDGYPLSVVVALAQTDYLAEWRIQTVILGLAGAGLMALLLLLFLRQRGSKAEAESARCKLAETLEFNRAIIAGSTVAIAVFHHSGPCVLANEACCRLVGGSKDEISALDFRAIPAWKATGLLDCAVQTLDTGTAHNMDVETLSSFGQPVWLEAHLVRITRNGENHLLFMGVDLAEKKRVENILATQVARYQSLLNTAADGVHVLDDDGNLVEASSSFLRMLGYSPDEAATLHVTDWDAKWSPAEMKAKIHELLTRPAWFETKHRRRDGSVLDVEISAGGVVLDGKNYVYASARDATQRKALERELKRSNEELSRLAITDPLSGLANRRRLLEWGAAELVRSRRFGSSLAILLIDIDHFKRINDSWGHAVGDSAIRAVAGCCQRIVREVDMVGRLGGEEFAVICPEAGAAAAGEIAERLRRAVTALELRADDGAAFQLTVSIGVAERRDEPSFEILLGRADAAMYEAKKAGRNRVAMADDGRCIRMPD